MLFVGVLQTALEGDDLGVLVGAFGQQVAQGGEGGGEVVREQVEQVGAESGKRLSRRHVGLVLDCIAQLYGIHIMVVA